MVNDTIVFYEHDEYVFALEKLQQNGVTVHDYGLERGTYAGYIDVPVTAVRHARQVLDDYFIDYDMLRF